MSVNENGNLRPDGVSVAIPSLTGRIGGTYYWNPGSPTAPHLTFTSTYGLPGAGLHAVFLKPGMTSSNTLGKGASGTLSTVFPSMTVNGSVPEDGDLISRLRRARSSSFEVGINTPDASPALTNTYIPQDLADLIFSPAGGPGDQLSPFMRSLQSGAGTVGQPSEPPIRYLGRRVQNPLGDGMAGWAGNRPTGITDSNVGDDGFNGNADGASARPTPAAPFATGAPPVPFLPPAPKNAPGGLLGLMAGAGLVDPSTPDQPPAGGLLGLMQEYLRNNPAGSN